MISLNQAAMERHTKEPELCQMCHKNPAEHSGICGDCHEKLDETKAGEETAPKHRVW
jgi:hypothetical protein